MNPRGPYTNRPDGVTAIIRRLAVESGPTGFRSDHPDLAAAGPNHARVCARRLVERGEIFTAHGTYRVTYFGRQEWADAQAVTLDARKPGRGMRRGVTDAIRRIAAATGPRGFRTDHPDLAAVGDATCIGNNVHSLIARGEVFAVRESHRRGHYFGRREWAEAYAHTANIPRPGAPQAHVEVRTAPPLRPSGEPIITERTKVTICPSFTPRFVALDTLPGVGALLRGRRYA